MTVASVLARGRRTAAALMTDTCTIRRIDPANPTTTTGGHVVPNYLATPVYAGPCKVQAANTQEATPEAGGHTFTDQDYRLDVPVAGYAPAITDVATLDTCAFDPNLVGRKCSVRALLHKSQATAYRLGVTFQEA